MKGRRSKKGISSLLMIAIIAFSVMSLIAPTATAAGEITATRDISDQTVEAGDTFTVTVEVTANQDVTALTLDEDLPSGWTVTEVDSAGAIFKNSTNEWLWMVAIPSGTTKTVIYNVTVPSDATDGSYSITGSVSAYGVSGIAVGGESSVTVGTVALEATRAISPDTVAAGGTFTVTVEVTANQDVTALALDEDLPSGWTVTEVDSAGAIFKNSTNEWLWMVAIPSGTTKTVIYNVTVPSDAAETVYQITGNVSAYGVSPIAVGGEDSVTVGVPPQPPTIVSYTISNRTITPPQTTEIDVEFSEKVAYRIAIEKDTATIYDWTGTAKDPDAKVWDGTYEANGTAVPAGVYTVNVSGTNTTTGLSVVNNTEIITVNPAPDLIVTDITPKCGYMFANETNNINATIKNNGGADAGAFNVGFDIAGAVKKVSVSGLAAGATTTVYVVDTTGRNAGDSVAITVTADCDGAISESNETNNAMSETFTVYNNGYKGKTYTGGENITTWKTFELKGNLLYSVGDSYYLSGYYGWATASYTVNWTASDLPVPAGATVKEARLYVPYTFDYADDIPTNVSLMFNGATKTFEAHYTDRKGFPKDYGKYGMLVYNVTDDFSASGNNATLTNSNWNKKTVSIRGMVLVVVYAYESEPKRAIFMNEEFDMLYGGASKCTTPEEATAYAPFSGLTVDTANVTSAELITVAPGAGPNEGELIFNGHKWTDVWNFAGATQIGINETDVTAYLTATENEAAFQSSEDWMEASNAILVVTIVPPNILDYYRCLYGDCVNVSTQELLTAADDWSNGIAPPGFTEPITTQQLMQLADEWSGTA